MAVIDTSMDMPKSCEACPNYQGENIYCLKGCFIPYKMFDIGDVIHVDCPLKEVNDNSVLEDIKTQIPNLVRYESADGQDLILAYDVMRLIDEYIGGKEQVNDTDH